MENSFFEGGNLWKFPRLARLVDLLDLSYPERDNTLDVERIYDILHDEKNRSAILSSQDVRQYAWSCFYRLTTLATEQRLRALDMLETKSIQDWTSSHLFPSYDYTPLVGERQIFGLLSGTDVFYDAAEDIRDAIVESSSDFRKVMTKAEEVLAQHQETTKRVTTNLDGFISNGNDTLSDIKNLLGLGKPQMDFVQKMKDNWLPIVVNLGLVTTAASVKELGAAVFNIGSYMGVTDTILSKIMDFATSTAGQQQSFDMTKKFAVLGLTMFSKFSPHDVINSFSTRMSQTTRDVKAIDEMLELFGDVLAEWGFDVTSKAKTVKLLQERVLNAIEGEAEYRARLGTKPSDFCDQKYFKKFMTCYDAVMDVSKTLDGNSFKSIKDTTFVNTVNQLKISYKGMLKTITDIRNASGSRVEPAAFVLVGPSGLGKTVWIGNMMKNLRARFNEKFADDDDFAFMSDIDQWTQWDQTATDDYHQGFNGQEVHVANELFASSEDNDHNDLLRFLSSDAFLTTQAALEDKGKPYLARLYVASANRIPLVSKKIHCMPALHRRFKIVICEASGSTKNFKTYDPDDDTLKSDNVKIDSTYDHIRFRICSIDEYKIWKEKGPAYLDPKVDPSLAQDGQGRLICRPRTSEELLDYMIKSMRIKEAFFNSRTQQQAGEQPFDDSRFKTRVDSIGDLLTKARSIKDGNGNSTFFRSLRKTRLGEEQLLLADMVARDNSYENFDVLFQELSALPTRPRLPAEHVILCKNKGSNTVWAWQDDQIFKTSDDMECWKDISTHVESDPLEFYYEEIAGKYAEYVRAVYTNLRWILPYLSGARIISSLFLPLKFSLYSSFAQIFVGLLLTYLYQTEDGAVDQTPQFQFWAVITDTVVSTITICVAVFFLWKIISKWMVVSVDGLCSECVQHRSLVSALNEYCEESCMDEHAPRCILRHKVTRSICSACEAGRCAGNCYHSIELDSSEHSISNYVSEEIQDLMDEAETEQSYPEGRKTRKVKVTMGRREESYPEGRRTKRIKLKLGRREYKFGGHQPGDQVKPKPTNVTRIVDGYHEMMTDPNSIAIMNSLARKSMVRMERWKDVNGKPTMCGVLHAHGHGHQVVSPAHMYDDQSPDMTYYVYRRTVIDGEKAEKRISVKLVKQHRGKDLAVWQIEDPKEPPFPMDLSKHLLTNDQVERLAKRSMLAVLYAPSVGVCQTVEVDFIKKQVVRERGTLLNYENVFGVVGAKFTAPHTSAGDCGGLLIAVNRALTHKVLAMHVVGTRETAFAALMTIEDLKELGLSLAAPSGIQEMRDFDPEIDQTVHVSHETIQAIEQRNEEFLNEVKGRREMSEYCVIPQSTSKFQLVDDLDQVNDELILDNGNRAYLPPGDFEYLGEGPMYKPSSKTQLKKHPLFGTFPVTTAPAITEEHLLEDKTGLKEDGYGFPDLLITQTAKYGKTFGPLKEPELLDSFRDQLIELFSLEMGNEDLGISSMHEILNGEIAEDASHPLDMRTSQGVPFMNVGGKGRKKRDLCDVIQISDEYGKREVFRLKEHDPSVEKVLKSMETTEMLGRQGIRKLSIMKDCLKDEARPLHKVGAPRAFKSFPIEKLLVFRKYFLKFKTQWTKRRERFFHGVGVNVMSPQWAELYQHLAEVSNCGFDADFSRFDGNLRADFMDTSNEIILGTIKEVMFRQGKEMDKETETLMQVLLDEIVRSVSVSRTTVYMDTHGNPSGSPLTTVTNCLVNLLYHWYCFARITGFSSLAKFTEHVAFLSFGDDAIQTTNIEEYNFDSVQDIMVNELGQSYTTAAKEANGTVLDLSELTFLKRKFKVENGNELRVYSPIEPESIYQRFNWTNIDPNSIMDHCNVLDESLLEAAQHGREFYSDFVRRLRIGISALRVNQDYPRRTRESFSIKFTQKLLTFSDARRLLNGRYA